MTDNIFFFRYFGFIHWRCGSSVVVNSVLSSFPLREVVFGTDSVSFVAAFRVLLVLTFKLHFCVRRSVHFADALAVCVLCDCDCTITGTYAAVNGSSTCVDCEVGTF